MSSHQASRCTRALASVLAVVLVLSGCALFNPYVRAPALDKLTKDWGSGAERLPKAIDAAVQQRERYYGAISERAKLRNGMPLILVPVSALALYRGVTATTEGGRRLVLKLGLAGAGLYAMSSYYTVSPKERIYLAGVEALSCSIHAVEPLMFGAPELTTFESNLTRLARAISDVEGARAVVENSRAGIRSQNPAAVSGGSALARSTQLLRRAREVQSAGRQLQAQIALAARNLRGATERIVKQVSDQLEASEPDPSAVLKLGASLGSVASQIAHVPAADFQPKADAGSAQTETSAQRQELLNAIATLQSANDRLLSASEDVAAFTAIAAATAKHATSVETCQVATVAGELRVEPDLETKDLDPKDTLVLSVRSNMGIPDASLGGVIRNADKSKDAVTLTKTVEGNALIVRVVYAEAQDGVNEAILSLTGNERGSARRQIRLNLRPTSQAGTTSDQDKAEKDKAEKEKAAKEKADKEKADQAKKARAKTRRKTSTANSGAAAGSVAPSPTETTGGSSGPTTGGVAAPMPPPPPPTTAGKQRRDDEVGPNLAAAGNAYETNQLTIGTLKRIQAKLKEKYDKRIESTGGFDDDGKTRAAIRRVQERRKNEGAKIEINGQLSERVTQDILSTP